MKKLYTIISIALIMWLLVSWVDVVADNTHAGAKHSEYNAFVLLDKERG